MSFLLTFHWAKLISKVLESGTPPRAAGRAGLFPGSPDDQTIILSLSLANFVKVRYNNGVKEKERGRIIGKKPHLSLFLGYFSILSPFKTAGHNLEEVGISVPAQSTGRSGHEHRVGTCLAGSLHTLPTSHLLASEKAKGFHRNVRTEGKRLKTK